MDKLIREYNDQAFQQAFRAYFTEMGIQVSNWEGLFAGMTDEGVPTLLREDESGQVIGFIMFSRIEMTSWFFEDRYGFIREFWVAPEQRNKGIGAELLAQAEAFFARQGIHKMILTSDTAERFYLKHGYRREDGMVAKNKTPVYVK
ncbi:MAG: GNAT family N-acetyltransferase [Clostridia bacterium]|nr:GNAT family N-acetyltransferase [Clostridia bacterium]